MSNVIAPEGQVFVCAACGKRSRDKYGDKMIDHGWDASCVVNSVLCYDPPEIKNGKPHWKAVVEETTP